MINKAEIENIGYMFSFYVFGCKLI